MSENLLSIEQARESLGVGKTTLYKLIGEKKIKAKKIGKRTVILKSDLENFLNSLEDYKPTVGGLR